MRQGGRWELAGFLLILVAMGACAASENGLSALLWLVGLAVFIAGRFM